MIDLRMDIKKYFSVIGRIIIILFILLSGLNSPLTLTSQEEKKEPLKLTLPEPVSMDKSVRINGTTIDYNVTTGYLTLEGEYGDDQAHIFYTAYRKKNGGESITTRPITFSFNGGPGSSSVWLHLGILGPRRVLMQDDGQSIAPPYKLVDNEYSWLEETDLVFIDPVSTGYSRAAEDKKAKEYHGYNKDIESVGEFIRRYISDNDRWLSPKYIIGESYGTTRAAGLSDHLINKYGMYLNGIILVSNITNFGTARFDEGNDLPYLLFLPTYTASAWYHQQLSPSLQAMELPTLLKEVEAFAIGDYNIALMKGNKITPTEKSAIITKLHEYTGLSTTYLDQVDMRINIHKFCKELLRDTKEVIGRFDARYKDIDIFAENSTAEKDPSYQPTIQGCFSACINDYLGRELNYNSALVYEVLTGRVSPWDYSSFSNEYVNTAESLRKSLVKNPDMKVWIANGYYDLATPYFATEYTYNHLPLPATLADNIQLTYYPAGHMMYLLKSELMKMKQEAKTFYDQSKGN